jgi:hypothetical protein
MGNKITGRDYPLSVTPEPKVNLSLNGGGNSKSYNVNASASVPVYKGLSVGVTKSFNKNENDVSSGTSYTASLRVPLRKK